MRIEKFDGEIASAYGQPVSPALKFNGEFSAFGPDKNPKTYTSADYDSAIEEIRAAGKYPTNEDIVNFVNNLAKANQRQKSMQAALDAAGYVKPTLETDDQLQLRTLLKVFLASGMDEKQARETAEASLNKKFTS